MCRHVPAVPRAGLQRGLSEIARDAHACARFPNGRAAARPFQSGGSDLFSTMIPSELPTCKSVVQTYFAPESPSEPPHCSPVGQTYFPLTLLTYFTYFTYLLTLLTLTDTLGRMAMPLKSSTR